MHSASVSYVASTCWSRAICGREKSTGPKEGGRMILEVMQHRYLCESTDETGLKLRECIAAVERRDPETLKLLGDQQVQLTDLRVALERTGEAAAALAKPVEREATLFP